MGVSSSNESRILKQMSAGELLSSQKLWRLETEDALCMEKTITDPLYLSKQMTAHGIKYDRERNVYRTKNVWKFFHRRRLVGTGGFGRVYLGEMCSEDLKRYIGYDGSHTRFAIKVIPQNVASEIDSIFYNEISVLSDLKSCCLISSLVCGFADEHNYYVVTEFCEGGEVLDFMLAQPEKKFSERYASLVLKEILTAVNFCHSKGIAHLDIKPENIMLRDGSDIASIQLIDFGSAKRCSDPSETIAIHSDFIGTLHFAPPEIISQYSKVIDMDLKNVDMWSVGVLAYLFTTGKLPFASKNELAFEVRSNIYSSEYEIGQDQSISLALEDFLSYLLVKDSKDRMTAQEALCHPWILEADAVASDDAFDPMVLAGLKHYRSSSLMKRYVSNYLKSRLTNNQRRQILRVFEKFDANNDGFIQMDELASILQEHFSMSVFESVEEAKLVMQEFDINSDGVLSADEFIELSLCGALSVDQSRVRRAFRLMDKNGDGLLSRDELEEAFGSSPILSSAKIGLEINSCWAMDLIAEADENSDGMISFEEFQFVLQK